MADTYYGITDTGKRRKNNEDTFIASQLSGRWVTACVIDGLGGYEGGEIAADLAKKAITETLSKPVENMVVALKLAINTANKNIEDKKRAMPDVSQMACVLTLAQVDIENNKFHYAHVGDTRLYLFRDSSLVKITKDQSFVGFLEDNGRLTESEAMSHPKRNEINKALGFDISGDPDEYIETGDSPFLPGDMLLLCSDGLTDMINNSTMVGILSGDGSLEEKGKALVAAANDAGGEDNITVVLVHNNKQKSKHEAVKPLAPKKEAVVTEPEPLKKNVTHAEVTNTPTTNNGTVKLLSTLLTLAILTAAFCFYKWQQQPASVDEEQTNTAVIKRTPAEQALSDSLNQPLSKAVKLNAASGDIVITDTIFLNKDSLVIHGNGATFMADSNFAGPAFVLADNCRYVLFDSLTFSNFNVAVSVQRSGLFLKNVRFKNCNIPVMEQFLFPGNVLVTGSIPQHLFYTDSISSHTDSLGH